MGFHIFIIAQMILVPLVICAGIVYGVFQDRKRRSQSQIAVAVTIFALGMLMISQLSLLIKGELAYTAFLGIGVVLISKYVFRCITVEALFVFIIVKCYMDSIFCISKLIQYYVTSQLLSATDFFEFSVAYVFAFLLTIYPMWIFVRKLLRPLVNKTERMRFWHLVWAVPFLHYLIYRFGISPDYKSPELIMEGTERFLPLLWIASTFSSLVVMVKMMLEVTKTLEEREKRRVFERQIVLQEEQYERIQKEVEYVRKLEHDRRHHFLAIEGYARNGNLKGLQSYLREYQESMLPKEPLMICENYAVNAVVQHMIGTAEGIGVKVNANIDLPCDCGAAQNDLVIVIGNLLENAQEACERQKGSDKFINLRVFWAGKHVLAIVVENSYGNTIRQIDGIFISSKCDKEGIGTGSVREIASKYSGVANFEYNNDIHVFKASVLLNL